MAIETQDEHNTFVLEALNTLTASLKKCWEHHRTTQELCMEGNKQLLSSVGSSGVLRDEVNVLRTKLQLCSTIIEDLQTRVIRQSVRLEKLEKNQGERLL